MLNVDATCFLHAKYDDQYSILYIIIMHNVAGITIHNIRTLILQVEFPPTFEEQPMSEQWSWDQNPINLTCIATAIPNATITWWYRDREINREIIDRNYRVFGHGPRSDLVVTPLDLQYYGRYTCKAINPHGEAFYEIGLLKNKIKSISSEPS